MYITSRLREALWTNAESGLAVVHIPKAAGTSIRTAFERNTPFVSLDYLSRAHSPGCQCPLPDCRFARRHEERFLRSVDRRRLWCLHLGYTKLSMDEIADIPNPIPILLPLRPTGDRLESYFRYYWTMAEFARSSVVASTGKHVLTWNRRAFRRKANIPLFSVRPSRVRAVQNFQVQPGRYLKENPRNVDVNGWLADAFALDSAPFLYSSFLPGISSADDVCRSRLLSLHLPDLLNLLLNAWGFRVGRQNVSRGDLRTINLRDATLQLRTNMVDLVERDSTVWDLLCRTTPSIEQIESLVRPI